MAGEDGPRPERVLVEPDWLERNLGDRRVRAIDLRDRDSYDEGRIPGAVQVELGELGESRGGCDNVLLAPGEFGSVMSRLGVSNRDVVVAYDDHWGLPSSRLVWSLHYYGHASAVILNGGWDRWRDEGRPEGEGPAHRQAEVFQVDPDPTLHADIEWILQASDREDVVFLDTRSDVEFEQGHLPGAISWDWFKSVPPGSWECARDATTLQSELAEIGVHPTSEIVAYCRSGMRAAHTYVVLRHLGYPRVRLFDGSWQEWSIRSGQP